MNKSTNQYILIIGFIISLLVFAGIFLPKAFGALFWNTSLQSISLVKDQVYCKLLPKSCLVDLASLPINFGIYDYNENFQDSSSFAISHYFFDWNDLDYTQNLVDIFNENEQKNRWVMLTVEPFTNPLLSQNNTLLQDVLNGEYDFQTYIICNEIQKSPTPVFVRWGHEMERVTGRYPWAVENSQFYIDAYKHFVNTCNEHTDNVFYVWSPAGEQNLVKYWPGENYVDYVGLSLYSYDQFDKDTFGYVKTFNIAFGERYDLVKDYNLPIMITEFGINATSGLQKTWLYNASKSFKNYPLLKTLVFFNAIDTPGVWGDYGIPDWSIQRNVIK